MADFLAADLAYRSASLTIKAERHAVRHERYFGGRCVFHAITGIEHLATRRLHARRGRARGAAAADSFIRRNQKGGQFREHYQSRAGKRAAHRDLLRGPWLRIAGRTHPWLAIERRRVGEAARRAARGRPS